MQFSDRSTFEAAAASLMTEDFNSFGSDVSLAQTTHDVGDFTITTTLNNSILRSGSAGDVFTYTFDSAVTAFGVDLFALNDSVERTRIDRYARVLARRVDVRQAAPIGRLLQI